jgi:hypothetical protein
MPLEQKPSDTSEVCLGDTMANPRPERATRPAGRTTERRKSPRLRELLDDFNSNIVANRRELEFQFQRIAEIQADLDRIKQGWEKG